MADEKEQYPNATMDIEAVKKMSEGHAEWFCKMIKPIIVSFGIHFYGHGYNNAKKEVDKHE